MVGTGRDFWHNEAQETAVNGCDLLGGYWEKIEKKRTYRVKKKQKKKQMSTKYTREEIKVNGIQ